MANTKVQSEQIANDAVVTSHIADNVGLGGSPTTTTQSPSDNSTKIATTAYVDAAYAALVDSSPATLNTLNELAAALGDDANFSTTVTNSIATKLPLAGGTMTGNLTLNGADIVKSGSADLTIDVGGRIDLSADDNGEIRLFDGSSMYAQFKDDSDRLKIQSLISDADMMFVGNDNGSEVTALLLDMSEAGKATFNNGASLSEASDITSSTGASALLTVHNSYSSAANDVVLIRGGANESTGKVLEVQDHAGNTDFIVKGDGNVGIGTTSPAQKLEVAGRIRATTDPTFEAYEASGKRGGIQWDATNDFLKMFSVGGDIVFESQNNSGNVGIGTASPSAPLHVTRTASGYPILKLTQNGADQYNTVYLQNSDSTAATVVMGTGGGSVGNAAWANNAVFGTTSNANVVILQNDAEKLRVNSVADDATLKITQSSETGGQLLIRSNYSDPHYLATQGTNHSSGGWYWGYGVQMQGNGTTKSTFSNFSGSRSFVQLFGDRIQYNFAGAQNTTIGNAVSLTESVRIDAQGIKFNGDTATANALDDYEEGTWNVAVVGQLTQYNVGQYTKIGNVCTVHFSFTCPSNSGSPTAALYIGGLPFACGYSGVALLRIYNAKVSNTGVGGAPTFVNGGHIWGDIGANSNGFYVRVNSTNSNPYYRADLTESGTVLGATFTYITNT